MASSCILIKSCEADRRNGMQEAVRGTWMTNCALPCFFVHGRSLIPVFPGEIVVSAGDSYGELWQKTLGAIRWAYANHYDFMFNCCTDTYVNVMRLPLSQWWEHDYLGHRLPEGHASGGAGFWLSRRAMRVCLDHTWDSTWEDLQVFHHLSGHGIALHDDSRYALAIQPDAITVHLSPRTGLRVPDLMHACHDRFTND